MIGHQIPQALQDYSSEFGGVRSMTKDSVGRNCVPKLPSAIYVYRSKFVTVTL